MIIRVNSWTGMHSKGARETVGELSKHRRTCRKASTAHPKHIAAQHAILRRRVLSSPYRLRVFSCPSNAWLKSYSRFCPSPKGTLLLSIPVQYQLVHTCARTCEVDRSRSLRATADRIIQ